MPIHNALAFFLMLLGTVLFPSGTIFSQTIMNGPDTPPEADGQTLQQEISRKVSNINVQNNSLSVELADAEFGAVLQTIAQQSGFRVVMAGDVFNRKLSTKFEGMELERGLMRLFNLIREKNYAIKYDTKGKISLIEVFQGTASAMPGKLQPVARPQVQRHPFIPPIPQADTATGILSPATSRPMTARPPSIRPRALPQMGQQPSAMQVPPAVSEEQTDTEFQNGNEEEVREIPYIPVQKRPVYIPPKTP